MLRRRILKPKHLLTITFIILVLYITTSKIFSDASTTEQAFRTELSHTNGGRDEHEVHGIRDGQRLDATNTGFLYVINAIMDIQGGPKKNNTESMSNIHNKLNTCISSKCKSL